MRWTGRIACVLLVLALPSLAGAAQHVRVVLDISGSMKRPENDPGRQAILATQLLYDLANPNPSLGDSFAVIPFDPTWTSGGGAPLIPASTGAPLVASPNGRTALFASLNGLAYNGRSTFFSPCLQEAIRELESSSGGVTATRVVVLITDGVPDSAAEAEEQRIIRDQLSPRMEAAGIRFYVLGFGRQAQAHRPFLNSLVVKPLLGQVFIDPDGSTLARTMVEIFARSFGYSATPARSVAGLASQDLEGGRAPERVAVVVHAPGQASPPALHLGPPSGGALNSPEGVRQGGTVGGSYALQWVLSPDPGDYAFTTDTPSAEVALLRPTLLRLEVQPGVHGESADRVMAKTLTSMQVLVRPAAGIPGDPGPVDLSFSPHGERKQAYQPDESPYVWDGNATAPSASASHPTPDGRIYPIEVEFPQEPSAGQDYYIGYLELEARRGEAVVGSLRGPRAHRVEVYPRLRLSPNPLQADAVPHGESVRRALHRRETACGTFSLDLVEGRLPHLSRDAYQVRAELASGFVASGPFHQAVITLDGTPLDARAASPTSSPGQWSLGSTLSQDELLGEHQVCIRVGAPTKGDPSVAEDIEVQLWLAESPYDVDDVIKPFHLRAVIAPPGFFERWKGLLALGLVAVLLIAGLWFLRFRPQVPGDLAVRVGPWTAGTLPGLKELGEPSLLRRMLGLRAALPILDDEGKTLGWVHPVPRRHLLRLELARGMRLETPDGEPLERRGKDEAWVEVRRTYRVTCNGKGSYVLRLEYR